MSLFPAYSDNAKSFDSNANAEWLQNSSFPDIPPPSESKPGTNDVPLTSQTVTIKAPKEKNKSKKRASKRKDASDVPAPHDNFTLDTKRCKEYLTVNTISRPVVPKYVPRYRLFSSKLRKNRKLKRYYHKRLDDSAVPTTDNNCDSLKQEEELANTTGQYNQKLASNPHDVKLWLDYVKFQDVVYQFEKTYRKGSIAKGLRVLAERKLAIIDKALTHNGGCEVLLRERLAVAVGIYPADELQVQMKTLVEKEQDNIIYWQGYIEATQCSMSHCNTKSVLNLYTGCLSILHKLRRTVTVQRAHLEENILKMLYQCGLFLKQAGLFEQLWTLLKMYLDLNLAPADKDKFQIGAHFQEKQLVELEEIVFNSQLPLHELWLRTEKLRESCHWLPSDEGCEDPQRIVFPEDVAELIHPITMPENMFKLIATILTLLKVPLLPCRHTTMHALGLDYVPWALDSVECLLPLFIPFHPVDLVSENFGIDSRLAVGPQYLNVLPGQAEYLDFILTIMKRCADCCHGDDKTAITVWWIRFQRLLVILDKRFKMPRDLAKKIKNNIKNLLKQEENRNNVIYYCEYALIERAVGNTKSALNILQTALSLSPTNPIKVNGDQALNCHLYRTLIELHLDNVDDQSAALLHLARYVLERDVTNITPLIIEQMDLKFKHITLQFLQQDLDKIELPGLPVVRHFLPDFMTDWIALNGWFLFLTRGAVEGATFIDRILTQMDEKVPEQHWHKEVLFEFYVAMLFKNHSTNPGQAMFKVVDDVVFRAIDCYPNNLFFLSAVAKEQNIAKSFGNPWWKLKTRLIKTGRVFPILFLIVIANQQIVTMQRDVIETITGTKFEINDSLKNRLLMLFRHVTRPDMCTRRCGLVWRLYLQFVHTYFDPQLCRNVYYCAVEECPWLKALYIDAAIYIPAELAQIQDLLIEKELRIHVTPEELAVLRT